MPCFEPKGAPLAPLESAPPQLADLAGDPVEAEQSRRRADATPIRSVRDYSLAFLEDPDRRRRPRRLARTGRGEPSCPQDFALWIRTSASADAHRGRLPEAEDCFTVAIALRPDRPGDTSTGAAWNSSARTSSSGAAPRLGSGAAATARPRVGTGQPGPREDGGGDAAGAVADLTTALDLGASETRIYFIRALARRPRGRSRRSGARPGGGTPCIPADAESWVARGLARLPSDPTAALDDFEAALAIDPRCRSALQNKAAVLSERLGRTAEAIEILDRIVSTYPDYVPARVGRVSLARTGRRADAHRDAEESRRRDASGETVYRIACIYALTTKAGPADAIRALGMLTTALGEPALAEVARTDPDLDAIRNHAIFPDLLRTAAQSMHPAPGGRSDRALHSGPHPDMSGE